MRVLLINTVPTEPNGITNVIFNYQSHVNASKITFDYVSINRPSPKYVNLIEEKNGVVFIVERSAKRIFRYIIQLKDIIKKNKYDIVHIHTNSHTVVLELLAAKWGRCPVRIVHVHNTTCNSVLLHKLLTPLFNVLYTHALACGEDAGRWMFGDRPFKVLHNGVDVEKYAFNNEKRIKVRNELNVEFGDVLLTHVGAFNEQKNHVFLIEIFKELSKRSPKYRLLLIGDGYLRPTIEENIEEYGLRNRVVFTGNIDNVSDYLNGADFIIMPSLYEGLPLTLIEQQANGLKCVVSDTITEEADLTNTMTFISLDSSICDWGDIIERISLPVSRENQSRDNIKMIKEKGYSIQNEAIVLEKYYTDAIK